MGVRKDQLSFLAEVVPAEILSRIRLLPWEADDYRKTLVLADILIDTYPSGGGGILLDALGLQIPCVSFENNYMRQFDQTDWTPADEFIINPDLLAPRGDFNRLKSVVSRLITDEQYRAEIAQQSYEYIVKTRGNPEVSVRHCEEIYLRVIDDKLRQGSTAQTQLRVRNVSRPHISKSLLSWTLYQLKRTLYFGLQVIDRVAERLG
jgi:hypothetical protein